MSLKNKNLNFYLLVKVLINFKKIVNLYNISEYIILIDTSNDKYDETNDFLPPLKIIEYLSIV